MAFGGFIVCQLKMAWKIEDAGNFKMAADLGQNLILNATRTPRMNGTLKQLKLKQMDLRSEIWERAET